MNYSTFDKKTIKRSFSRAASTYDASSKLQRDVAEDLLEILSNYQDLNAVNNCITDKSKSSGAYSVLDIGCGTGTLLSFLKNKYPDINFFGSDFSLPMLFKAKEKNRGKQVNLCTSDSEYLPFKGSLFNLVISNLTYQWVPDITSAFQEVWRVLKTNGLFLFSTIGPQTLEELRISYRKTEEETGKTDPLTFMRFQDPEDISRHLKKVGFETLSIQNVFKKRQYKNLWELLRTLKATGTSAPFPNGKKTLARGLILKKTAKIYQKNFPSACGTNIIAGYHILFAAVRKR